MDSKQYLNDKDLQRVVETLQINFLSTTVDVRDWLLVNWLHLGVTFKMDNACNSALDFESPNHAKISHGSSPQTMKGKIAIIIAQFVNRRMHIARVEQGSEWN